MKKHRKGKCYAMYQENWLTRSSRRSLWNNESVAAKKKKKTKNLWAGRKSMLCTQRHQERRRLNVRTGHQRGPSGLAKLCPGPEKKSSMPVKKINSI